MTGADDTISVVIPTCGRPVMLRRALESVLRQTHSQLEVFIVLDPRPGAAPSAAAAREDPRVRRLTLAAPGGAARARNLGLAQATGPWTAFLDDDDEWQPDKLQRQLDTALRTGAGAVYCGYELVSDNGTTRMTPWLPEPDALSDRAFLRDSAFNCSVPLLRTDLVRTVRGFDEELLSGQDKDLWMRLARVTTFARVSDVLVLQHIHGRQMTAELDRKIGGRRQLMAKHRTLLEADPALKARFLERLGLMECCRGQRGEGLAHLAQAARLGPLSEGAARVQRWAESDALPDVDTIRATVFRSVDGVTLYY